MLLLLGGHGPQALPLEGGHLRLQIEYSLLRVPALLQRSGDQAVSWVDGLVAPFGQVDLVTGALNAPTPLPGGKRQADRNWRGSR
ncbi:hypothetical protein A9K66_24590 [Mesorhizobium sp. AA23]|nr:hypothetical protein A9K66_24590 [Mesorhizobium sp. AA23]